MLTGRTTAPAPGLSFYDAWETAGPPTPGYTWSNDNPWAQISVDRTGDSIEIGPKRSAGTAGYARPAWRL